MMNVFTEIGARLKAQWQTLEYDEAAFAELAVRTLRESAVVGTVTLRDVLAWVQSTPVFPTQIEYPFGKPITVFHDPKFYIDILTWIDGTTGIHEHGFAGAFMVLEGASLHARYRFQIERRYNEHLHLGRTELVELELLRVGDVRPIHPGERSAHALFHLERPSVSIVVRTPKAAAASIQLQYLRSGIAFNPFHEDLQTQRLIRSLEIMRELDDPAFLPRARALIDQREGFTAFKIADYVSRKLDHEEYRGFMKAEGFRHRELFAALAANIDDDRREANLIGRRRSVRSEPHRFLLALLLNLRGYRDILRMVEARYPGRDPVDTVMTWVAELAAMPPTEPGEANAIGIDLDEVALAVMAAMLRGASDDDAIDGLADTYDGVDDLRDGLRELCAAVRESVFFGSLFA